MMTGNKSSLLQNFTSEKANNFTDEQILQYLKDLESDRTNRIFLPSIIFIGILGIVGIVGNTLVVIVYAKYFKRSPSRVFILAVAVFDLISNLLCVPGEIVDIGLSYSFPNPLLCKFFRFNNFFTTVSSLLTLVVISVERYMKICRPFNKQINERIACKIIIVVVVTTIILACPSVILSGLRSKKTPIPGVYGHDCTFSDKYSGTAYPKIFLGSQFLMFIICAIVLIVLYSLIGLAIYRQNKRRNTMCNNITRARENAAMPLDEVLPEISTDSTGNEQYITQESTKNKISKTKALSAIEAKINRKYPKDNSSKEIAGDDRKRKGSVIVSTVKKYKTTLMLLTITVAFIFSYLPYLIISVIKISVKDFEKELSDNAYIAYTVSLRSYFINAAINSVIYSFWNKTFRDGVVNLFSRKRTYSPTGSQIHSY